MGTLRFLAALWAAKLSRPILKLTRHNGTNFPGELAVRICPDFLERVGKPRHILAVTGTNGKTTACNLLIDLLAAKGERVLHNREGSNINTGLATTLALGATLLGRCRSAYGVFEIDERWTPRILPYVRPEYLLITNLSRDSVPRNGHPAYIAGLLGGAIPPETRLILNADDLISCGLAPENARTYFGIRHLDSDTTVCRNRINDVRLCPHCSAPITYDVVRYHHIGRAHCQQCGFRSPDWNYAAQNVDMASGSLEIAEGAECYPCRLISDSVFNIYNEIAVAALLRELGWSREDVCCGMDQVEIVGTRYQVTQAGGVRVVLQMAKDMNAYACSRAFDYVTSRPGEKEIVLMLKNANDIHGQSENVCWLYDCDFEFLNQENIVRVVAAGRRSRDLTLRLLLAGVPEERICRVEEETEVPERLLCRPGTDVYLLYGTDALPLVRQVRDAILARAEGRQGE